MDNDPGRRSLTSLAHMLIAAGAFGNVIPAEVIAHGSPRASPVPAGITKDYGEYLVRTTGCQGCHGAGLGGAQPSEPGAPFAPNLTSGGSLRSWTDRTFMESMRTRDSKYMPFKQIGAMTDDELKAVWAYLQSLPPQTGAGK